MVTIIDGREVELSDFIHAQVGDYTVWQDKLWVITARSGPAIGNSKVLERENAGEKTVLSNNIPLFRVMKPTGYLGI